MHGRETPLQRADGRIRVDELALEEKRTLARLLKKRFEREQQAIDTTIGIPAGKLAVTGQVPVAMTLVQQVERALPVLGQREFVVGDVADALRAGGVEMPEKPNPKIATVLARLQSAGVLKRTFTGGGNVPNRYRVEAATPTTAKANESSATRKEAI